MNHTNELASQVWKPEQHCAQLDGVRGLAILVVTIYRFTKEVPTDSWLSSKLHSALLFGNRGVDLFFVLSGFLITGVLLQSKGKSNFFKRFYWRRSLRIFPLYFIALFALLVIAPAVWFSADYPTDLSQPLNNQGYLWTYSSNLYMSFCGQWNFGAMDHFWSLCVEEHFYFFWPIVIFILPNRWSLAAAIMAAIASASARSGFAYLGGNRVATDVLTVFRMDGLCLGAALAIAMTEFPEWIYRCRKWMMPTFAICFTVCFMMQFNDVSLLGISHFGWAVTWTLFLALLVTSVQHAPLARFCNLKLLRNFGKYSYAMYVFQLPQITLLMPVIGVATFAAIIPNATLSVLIYATVMIAINYSLAVLSWNCIEKHCLKLKDAFFTDKQASGAANKSLKEPTGEISLRANLQPAK